VSPTAAGSKIKQANRGYVAQRPGSHTCFPKRMSALLSLRG